MVERVMRDGVHELTAGELRRWLESVPDQDPVMWISAGKEAAGWVGGAVWHPGARVVELHSGPVPGPDHDPGPRRGPDPLLAPGAIRAEAE